MGEQCKKESDACESKFDDAQEKSLPVQSEDHLSEEQLDSVSGGTFKPAKRAARVA